MLSDTGYARLRGAGRKLNSRLKAASKSISGGNPAQAYAALDNALIDFIGDRLNTETRGMVTEQIVELLSARKGLDPALIDQVRDCLEHFAFARFAPGSNTVEDARDYLDKVRKLVMRLDRAF